MITSTQRATAKPSRTVVVLVVSAMLAILGIMAERAVTILSHAGHDDMLFMRQALSLLRFEWLGGYNQLTLAKGPGLPAFLAIGHLSGLPFPYVQLGTLLVSLMVFSWAVARLLRRPWLFPLLALVLMLMPSLYADSTARIMRETLFISLTFLLLAALAGAAIPGVSSRRSWVLGAAAGLALGALWLTREEGVTVLPMIALFGLAGLIRLRASGWKRGGDWSLLKSIAATMIVFVLVLGAYASLNALAYGQFVVNEVKSGNFPRAMTALQRASYAHRHPLLPVPRAARMEIYRESPTFNQLRSYLDPDDAPSPWNAGCAFAGNLPKYESTCGDIAGGWWMWGLRDAAASIGAYESPKTAEAFYGALAREVEEACASGRLVCSGWRPPLIPPMVSEQWQELPWRTWKAFDVFALGLPLQITSQPSTLAPEWRRQLLELLNFPRVATGSDQRSMFVNGWYWRPGGGFIRGEGVDDGTVASMQWHDSPDVAVAVDPEARQQRFLLRYECPNNKPQCLVRFVQEGGAGATILDLATLRPGGTALGDGHLQIDSVIPANEPPVSIRTYAYQGFIALLGALIPFYRVLCILGPAAFLIALVRHRGAWMREPAIPLATALMLGIAARAVVLALIDLTSWPALASGYLYPASGPPMLVAFAVLSITAAAGAIRKNSESTARKGMSRAEETDGSLRTNTT